MKELFSFFRDVNSIFWGNDVFFGWFLFSIIIILVLEKQEPAKLAFAKSPVFFLVLLFNPVFFYITRIFTNGALQYQARLYSMIPLPWMISLGTVLLINWVCRQTTGTVTLNIYNRREFQIKTNQITKVILIFMVLVIIVYGGTNIYRQDWMKSAQNIAKVPNEAIWICDYLKNYEKVTIAVPDSLSSYIRQIDAGIHMPYARNTTALSEALSQNSPDAEYIMSEAGQQACDYIVVNATEENINAFREKGWEPEETIGGYYLFRVEGIPRIKNTYDEKNRLILSSRLDSAGNIITWPDGYTDIAYEYDKYGNVSGEIYLDKDGRRYLLDEGYASIEKTYTHFSRKVRTISHLDDNELPVNIDGRYMTQYDYDNRKNLVRESYYDENGHLMNRTDALYAYKEWEYDQNDNISYERYYNVEGNLELCENGYAECRREYNDKNNKNKMTREAFFDTYGNVVLCNRGYASHEREYNEGGWIIKEVFYGVNNEPVIINRGYAILRRTYDQSGNIITESYYDTNDNAVCNTEGYAVIKRFWDEKNQLIRELYFDTDGQLIDNPA